MLADQSKATPRVAQRSPSTGAGCVDPLPNLPPSTGAGCVDPLPNLPPSTGAGCVDPLPNLPPSTGAGCVDPLPNLPPSTGAGCVDPLPNLPPSTGAGCVDPLPNLPPSTGAGCVDPLPNLPPSTGAGTEEFPRLQPRSLIVCAPAFSSPVGVEPLQRRYKALQAVTEALPVVTEPLRVVTQSLRSRYESLHSRYGAVTNLASRYGVGRLKMSLCLTAAFAPVPAILGGSCPLGCSLSAPATGGLSMVSPQYIRYAAGSEKEKRGAHFIGDTIAQ